MTTTSFVVGLLGDNIGGSLAKPLQEGEGEAQGLSLAYRLVDADAYRAWVWSTPLTSCAGPSGWASTDWPSPTRSRTR